MKKGKKLKMYLPFATNTFQKKLSYRANVVIFILGDAIMLAVTYYLWKAIYSSSPNDILNGFSLNEMIIYILISFITSGLTSVNISNEISREVKDGSIAINLIRPISYQKRMLFQVIGGVMYNFVVIFIFAFISITILFYKYTGTINLVNILIYFFSMLLSILLNFYCDYAFGLLAFKVTNMWGLDQIIQAVSMLVSGTLIPITFFPKQFQIIFNFLPFSSIIYTPTMIYLGKLSGEPLVRAIGIQIIWICILALIVKFIWNTLIKEISILGG